MRRPVLIAGALAVMASAYVLVLSPMLQREADLRAALEGDYASLQRYRAFVGLANASSDDLEKEKKGLERLERGVIKDKSEPLAFASLQLKLQDTAKKAGLDTQVIRPLKPEKDGGYKGLPIYLEAEGKIGQISDFLKLMDRPGSWFRVDKLMISRKDAGEQKQLKLKVQVSGLMRL